MIRFIKLSATDTFAYAQLDFDFESGIYSIGGKNGHCKSSLYLTLCQGLYNKNPKNSKIDKVNNVITGKPSVINIVFEKDGSVYEICNSRKTNSITILKKDGDKVTDLSLKRIPENLALIEDILGVSYSMFVMLTFQDSTSTLDLVEDSTDTARKQFAGKVLQFEDLDELNKKVKDALKDAKKDFAVIEGRISALKGTFSQIRNVEPPIDTSKFETEISKVSEELEGFISRAAAIDVTLNSAEATNRRVTAEAAAYDKAQDKLVGAQEAIDRFTSPYASSAEAEDAFAKATEARQSAERALAVVRTEARKLVAPAAPKAPETVCSRCGSHLSNDAAVAVYEADLISYKEKKEGYEAELARCAAEDKELYAKITAHTKEANDAEYEVKKWARLFELYKSVEDLAKVLPPSDKLVEIADLQETRAKISSNISCLRQSLAELKNNLTSAEKHNTLQESIAKMNCAAEAANEETARSIGAEEKRAEELDLKIGYLTELVTITGPSGYRLVKMNKFLAMLNAAMVKYSRIISEGKMNCRFYVSDDGKIEFEVWDADKQVPYENWSTGEKARVKLACLFSVIDILEYMGSVSFNLLFLDEIFAPLDSEGREGLFRTLALLKEKGKCVYTIAHTPIANAVVFDRIITAVKTDGIATLS